MSKAAEKDAQLAMELLSTLSFGPGAESHSFVLEALLKVRQWERDAVAAYLETMDHEIADLVRAGKHLGGGDE